MTIDSVVISDPQAVPHTEHHDLIALRGGLYSETAWPIGRRFRPLSPLDVAIFDADASLGCIIRQLRADDCYNLTERADFQETWSFSLAIVFRSGFIYHQHCGKGLSRLMGEPVDVAHAYYRDLARRADVLEGPRAHYAVYVEPAVLALGSDAPARHRRAATFH